MGAPGRAQFREPVSVFGRGREEDQGQQSIVQLVGVADLGPRFLGDLRDGSGIEIAHAGRDVGLQRTPQLHRPGAAFFERSIVEIGVGVRV